MVIDTKLLSGWKLFGANRPASRVESDAEADRQRQIIAGEFDPEFYVVRYPDVTDDPLDHFLTFGWREGRDPAPWFSTAFYLEANPDVGAAGLNPFCHYLEHGREEGRAVGPAELPAVDRSWEIDAVRSALDQDFYEAQLHRSGIAPGAKGLDLALHYWREGAALGLDPAEDFSTSQYLADHQDVAAAAVNPFAHYLREGRKEGRLARPPQKEAAEPRGERPKPAPEEERSRKSSDHQRDLASAAFDSNYYLAANPDVAAAGIDPLKHFLDTGWREGRNPTLWFSVSHYLDFYPDVAAADINPFVHYLMAGKSEGRSPRHDLGFRYDVISSLRPIDEQIEHARTSSPKRKPAGAERLRDALKRAARLTTKGLYLTVSHDDFTENFGGVQLVLMRESAAVDAMGFDHLHLFPALPLPVVELETSDPLMGVLINRERVGFFEASEIAKELAGVSSRIVDRPFAIHSLIGHNTSAIVSILKAAGCRSGWYWVHDYSSVCAGYTLLRNNVEFCGGPPPGSTACSICVYGPVRSRQMKAHEHLFEELELTVLAPSQAALDVWKASASILAPAEVHEHLRISETAQPLAPKKSRSGPLRVAYVGQPVTHKGWPVFKELAVSFADDPRYEFFHVGKNPEGIPATFKEVAVGSQDLNEMVRTLAELDVDVALLWSLWPETFCIAAVEALRAGAAVVTFRDSGNVAAMVKDTGLGAVLDSEKELMALFESGKILDIVTETRPLGLTAEFSDMTADFLKGVAA